MLLFDEKKVTQKFFICGPVSKTVELILKTFFDKKSIERKDNVSKNSLEKSATICNFVHVCL